MIAKSTALGGARAASQLGEDMLFFVLPVLAYKTTRSLHDTGLIFFTILAANLAGCVLSGLLSDRVGERRVFSVTTALRAVLAVSALLLLSLRPETALVPVLMVVATLDGVLSGTAGVAFEATGPRLCGGGAVFTRFQAFVQGADQLAVLGGPLAGALALTHLGGARALLPIGALFLFSAAAYAASTTELARSGAPRDSGPWRSSAREAVHVIRSTPPLVSLLILTMLDNLVLGLFAASIVPLGLGLFGVGEEVLGTTISTAGTVALATVVACPFLLRRHSLRWLWILSYALAFAGLFLLGVAPRLLVYGVALALVEISCAQGIYALRIIRARVIPNQHLGKVLGLLSVLQQATLPIGGLVVTAAATPERLRAVFVISTAVVALVTFVLIKNVLRATAGAGLDAEFLPTHSNEALPVPEQRQTA